MGAIDAFEPWLDRWRLMPDGDAFESESSRSRLMPVLRGADRAMLKIAVSTEEIRGAALMAWWDGDGAARVLAHDGAALLLERATSRDGLVRLSRTGRDPEATAVLCDTVERLHRARAQPPPDTLIPLQSWFGSLRRAVRQNRHLARGCDIAEGLLTEPQDIVVLHGDVHHANVLDFGERGWLAVDPKGLVGERAYDYANIFLNPDADTALAPGRMHERLEQVGGRADLEPGRLIRWVAAYAALSAAWSIEDRQDVSLSLRVLEAALQEFELS